jgi:hypothetical protein
VQDERTGRWWSAFDDFESNVRHGWSGKHAFESVVDREPGTRTRCDE